MGFTIKGYSFWTPGTEGKPVESLIADMISLPVGTDASPDIDFVPMMTRRRFSQLSKMFFYAAHKLLAQGEQMPVFFVSKYGEINRQYAISKKLIEDGEVLPTPFGFSVFNTAPALFSIFSKNHRSAIAINCSDNLLETGLTAVLAFLKKGTESGALLIIADEKPPDEYLPFAQKSNVSYVAGFIIGSGQTEFTLEFDAEAQHTDDNKKIPDFFRFLLENNDKELPLNGMRIFRNE